MEPSRETSGEELYVWIRAQLLVPLWFSTEMVSVHALIVDDCGKRAFLKERTKKKKKEEEKNKQERKKH